MKIISRAATEFFTANPSPEGLRGYSLDKQLRTAVKTATKPLAKRLAHYRSETARLQANCDKWSVDSYNSKLDEITARAHAGDADATNAIESGAVPSRQSYAEMHGRFCRELEQFQRDSRALFGEVLPLIKEPMVKAVAVGQDILDSVLEGVGVPRFTLEGWSNHNGYIWKQIEHASRNESADLSWFWSAVE
jgi:hypothetical protein